MASIRANLYSHLLRRALRSGLLPDGVEGLQMVRNGENRGRILSMIMGQAEPGAAIKIGTMDAEWVGDENADRTLLYLHGGGYVLGSIDTHRSMVTRLCKFDKKIWPLSNQPASPFLPKPWMHLATIFVELL